MIIVAGVVAGRVVAGRRGQLGFAVAFGVFAFAAWLVLYIDLVPLPLLVSQRYERVSDMILLSLAYPTVFAVMGSLGATIVAHDRKIATRTGRAFAIGGLLGGMVFVALATLHPRGGPLGVLAFAATLAIPGFAGGRTFATLLLRQPGGHNPSLVPGDFTPHSTIR